MTKQTLEFKGASIDASAPVVVDYASRVPTRREELIGDILRVARFHYDRRAEEQVAMLLKKLEAELIDEHKRVLWGVCQGYGKAGECVYITFNHKVQEGPDDPS